MASKTKVEVEQVVKFGMMVVILAVDNMLADQ